MTAALLGARLLLAGLFAVAAAGKLADRRGLRETLWEFGVRDRIAEPGSLLLPVAELAVAVLLVVHPTARLGGVAAVVLLAVFCAAIVRVLARGERPTCGCLGRAHSAQVGSATLVRNAVLGLLATLVAVYGAGDGLWPALAGFHLSAAAAALVAISFAVTLVGWFGWQILRQNGRLLERVSALEASLAEHAAAD